MHQTIHVVSSFYNEETIHNYNVALKTLTKNPSLRMAYGANKWRHTDAKFNFAEMYPNLKAWQPGDIKNLMNDPIFTVAFGKELDAAMKANVCVIIMPADINGLLMAGFMAGLGKKVVALCIGQQIPALMLGAFHIILTSWKEFESYFLVDYIKRD